MDAIADGLIGFSGPYILPDTSISEWGKNGVIKCG